MTPVSRIHLILNDKIVVTLITALVSKKSSLVAGKAASGNVTAKKHPVLFSLLGNLTTQGNQKKAYRLCTGNMKWV
jgi:hypothetical protein